MSYTLVIEEYAYSDRSMVGWLEVDAFGIDFHPKYVPMLTDEHAAALTEYAPARSLPVLLADAHGKRSLIWESAAAAEILADRHPHAGLWPQSEELKERARALAVRANCGFQSLRSLPMNLHARYQGFSPSKAQQADVDELTELWAWALRSPDGPYLCGASFCAADAAFAPIATRLITYGFEVPKLTMAYIETLYAHPSLRRWHACADAQLRKIECFHQDLPSRSNKGWPRQPVLPGQSYNGDMGDAINDVCPFSGYPIVQDSLAEIDGLIVGFCNPFCCRRGMADAECWPTVMSAMARSKEKGR